MVCAALFHPFLIGTTGQKDTLIRVESRWLIHSLALQAEDHPTHHGTTSSRCGVDEHIPHCRITPRKEPLQELATAAENGSGQDDEAELAPGGRQSVPQQNGKDCEETDMGTLFRQEVNERRSCHTEWALRQEGRKGVKRLFGPKASLGGGGETNHRHPADDG